ncbi:hypothetical protein Acsp03_70980 [Actinomadura sp. NBRC 104412]|nr:hypothetical protein Acsp03_70980 [Actinomadura sp. NBRC 104412]
MAKYLVRMRGRATPFGVFASVAPLRFGMETSAYVAGRPLVRCRADARWLAEVITRLESYAEVRHRLPLVLNDLATVRGERIVVPWAPHISLAGHRSCAQISVRRTRPVETLLAAARIPVRGGDLIGKLTAEMPHLSAAGVDGMLSQLLACGVLISALRPDSTVSDGLAHVLACLDAIEASTIKDVRPLVADLREIDGRLRTTSVGRAAEPLRGRMRALSDVVEQPIMADLRVDTAMVLPRAVADEVASAASALIRATPHPTGDPRMREYHARFVARYGLGALVRVAQLVDPTIGLGLPAHYDREEGRTGLDPRVSRRDEHLLVLAQQAALDGAVEVKLEDAFLDRLAAESGGLACPAPHMEMCAELRAASADELDRGEFTLAVHGVGRSGLALSGRFLDLLDAEDRQRMRAEYGRLPTAAQGAMPAQLSFAPRSQRLGNVARAPQVLPAVLGMGEYREPSPDLVAIDDLAITADADRLYVVSLSRRRVVEPVVANAAARRAWPPLARLLVEIARSGTAAVSPFAWGAASCLPFLPRVRYRRSVLCPARWRVPARALPFPGASEDEWARALDALRERLRLPVWVSVGEADRLLRLNLNEPMDRALLCHQLEHAAKSGVSTVIAETSAPADHGWTHGRVHELVVPLASATPPAPVPATVTGAVKSRSGLIGVEHGVFPGRDVLSAHLYGDPDQYDEILDRHLPQLIGEVGEPMWWFLRYRDRHPHLRLRLHPRAEEYGATVVALGDWASDLRRRGLVGELTLSTYRPEIVRYGSGPTMDAAEALFAADSAAALAQIALSRNDRDIHAQSLTAASMIDLAAAMTGGQSTAMRWFLKRRPFRTRRPLPRERVRQAVQLADPSGDHAFLRDVPDGELIIETWRERRRAAASYLARLRETPSAPAPESVLVSLLHLHHIRAVGIDADSEEQVERMARAVALGWASRKTHSTGGLG